MWRNRFGRGFGPVVRQNTEWWLDCVVDRDCSFGIATRYWLDGPGIESRWGRDFLHPSRPSMGPTQPPIQWVPGLVPGGKVARPWRWPPATSSAEVKGRAEIYLCFPSGPSWSVLGWSLPMLYLTVCVLTPGFEQKRKFGQAPRYLKMWWNLLNIICLIFQRYLL
jgi:hypothetical protein